MKLIDRVKAYKALQEMMQEEWDFDFAYKITSLMRDLEKDFRFFSDEEMKLVVAYGKKEENGKVAISPDHSFSFANEHDLKDYVAAYNELVNSDTDDMEKIILKQPVSIKGEWLLALEPFCIFEGDNKNND